MDIKDFVKLTSGGLDIASFTEIREGLINYYKEAYAIDDDVDLSTGTADGVFINNVALIINNILKCMAQMYANLNVDFATGRFLDILCKLSNVYRKGATRSSTFLTLTNISNENKLIQPSDVDFVDKSGMTWNLTAPITIAAGQTLSVYVECSVDGPIQAPAGWIYQTDALQDDLTVIQANDAIPGKTTESDAELRSRLAYSSSASGLSTFDGLVGALLNISGIKDVYIYNNNTSSTETLTDNTEVSGHSIYVTVRKEENVDIPDATIGSIIYEKLTPGISTTESADTTNGKSFDYVDSSISSFVETEEQTVYWKQAPSILPQFSITFSPYERFVSTELYSICNTLKAYIDALPLNHQLTEQEIQTCALNADPLSRGRATYYISDCTFAASNPDNNIEYYNAQFFFVSWSGTVIDENATEYTITDGTIDFGGDIIIAIGIDAVADDVSSAIVATISDNQFVFRDTTYTIVERTFNKTVDDYVLKVGKK